MLSIYLLVLDLSLVQLSQCVAGSVVVSPAGAVRGWERLSRDGRLFQAWTKIPYAQPPVGRLRFMPPKPATKWRGVLNATDNLPHCLQRRDASSSEDCLYLSVYRPKFVNSKMPVVLHIFGGGFSTGNSGPREQADYLMDEDLVLVGLEFRVNGFGFATLGDDIMPGNYGLKDIVMALRWVRTNIKSFGGDPNRVTLLGSSTGAETGHILLNSPATQDLVTGAFTHSGSMGHVLGILNTESVKNWTLESATLVGCNGENHREILVCLQKANTSLLTSVFGRKSRLETFQTFPVGPVIEPATAEEAVITEDLSLFPSTKPWAMSVAIAEYIVYMDTRELIEAEFRNFQQNLTKYLMQFIRNQVGSTRDEKNIQEGAEMLKHVYFPRDEPVKNFTTSLAKMYADCDYYYPAMYNMKQHRGPKWLYQFEYRGEMSVNVGIDGRPFNITEASHADNEEYFFNLRSSVHYAFPEETSADYAVSKRLNKYLYNFASHGDPNPTGSTTWRQFGDVNIFRVTGHGDTMGDRKFSSTFEAIFELWSTIVGWTSAGIENQ